MSSYKTDKTESNEGSSRYAGMVFKDRYSIEKRLGAGGIGEVYLAHDSQLHSRPVVIKVLLEDSATDPWLRKKFKQEIEALARIDHPGIVGIVDSGDTPDGKPFLAMQYVKGCDLRSMITPKGMPFDQVATIINQIARALSAAHDVGVLHCDLKPENIMLQELGEGDYQVKIVDFGISKIKNSQVQASAHGTKVAGTAYYMAPEQVLGQPEAVSDNFALGVIAYEMLTGSKPFDPPSIYQVIETIQSGVKFKPRELRLDLKTGAEQILLKAVSFEAADRYQRARDFGGLLAQSLTTDLELPVTDQVVESQDIEMVHVVFMDIVSYSKLPTDEQKKIIKLLQNVVIGSGIFQRAKTSKQVVSRSTGDGMALVFFGSVKMAVECAVEIARSLRQLPQIKLRMGLNSGPVYRVNDMNETVDVAGAGINMAQRVMDCGDAGHILLSKNVADVIGELGEWRGRIRNLGECRVKHGATVQIYNLVFEGVGNPLRPQKFRRKIKTGFAIALGLSLIVLLLLAAGYLFTRNRSPVSEPQSPGGTKLTMETERVVKYWMTIQKCSGKKRCDEPFRLASDAAYIFEKGYRAKLNVTTPNPGFFYVLNESLNKVGDNTQYIILYPSVGENQQSDATQIELPKDDWFEFDDKQGTEKLWVVWSEQHVAEFEAVKELANSKDEGRIKDPAQNVAIGELLKKNNVPKSSIEKDEANRQTSVKARSGIIVYSLNLEHR